MYGIFIIGNMGVKHHSYKDICFLEEIWQSLERLNDGIAEEDMILSDKVSLPVSKQSAINSDYRNTSLITQRALNWITMVGSFVYE